MALDHIESTTFLLHYTVHRSCTVDLQITADQLPRSNRSAPSTSPLIGLPQLSPTCVDQQWQWQWWRWWWRCFFHCSEIDPLPAVRRAHSSSRRPQAVRVCFICNHLLAPRTNLWRAETQAIASPYTYNRSICNDNISQCQQVTFQQDVDVRKWNTAADRVRRRNWSARTTLGRCLVLPPGEWQRNQMKDK